MRLESVRIHNIGPFRDAELDLAQAGDARLIAVVGPNGAGKSTLLEVAIPGACYRETPTRGTLASLATARDAFVEARLVNGKPWTIRHSVDAVSGKGESLVLDDAGSPVLPDTKVKAFSTWAASALPSPEVLYASTFAPQSGGGFLAATAGERKATLLRILGVERLEKLAQMASERARSAKAAATTLDARLGDERARAGDVALLEAKLAQDVAAMERAEETLTLARKRLAEARESAQAARERQATHAVLVGRRREAEQRLAVVMATIEDVERRLANNRGLLGEAADIRSAVARKAEVLAELGAARTAERDHRERVRVAEVEVVRLRRQRADLDSRIHSSSVTLAKLNDRLAVACSASDVRDELPGLQAAVEAAREAVAEAARKLEAARKRQLAGGSERIAWLRSGLSTIAFDPCDDPKALARDTLKDDDDADREAKEAPAVIADAERELATAVTTEAAAGMELQLATRRAMSAADPETVRLDIKAEMDERLTLEATRADIDSMLTLELTGLPALTTAVSEAARFVEFVEAQLDRLEPIASKAEALARAEARIAELEPQLEAAKAERVRLIEATADPLPSMPPPPPDLAIYESGVAAYEKAAREAHAAVTLTRSLLERAREAEGRIAELKAQLADQDAHTADWTLLAQSLGRDGLQALEIDAAGPELTALINDLLHHCVGPRWTVSIETQRLSANGNRLIEGCEVRVVDAERGREAPAESLSGGERVIIGEAVSLALSMLACRRAGLQRPTLCRDESGAALDVLAARAYVSMLRRAAELVDADRILLVSHSPEVWDLCDARIEVRDGRISIS